MATNICSSARYLSLGIATLLLVSFSSAAQSNSANPAAWSGTIVSSACNADEAFNESPECMKTVSGAKLALYDDTNRVMYTLEPQTSVAAHLGDSVTVHGNLDVDTIQVTSMEPMSIGL